ncbi:MAG: molybdopterin oxidoreductase family protein [Burkholderiaceae bacterium]|jgi:anaerobic selenocysteine-containing dehydrogenase|nr:molybdopterin oxidoreductase family protein [Burkholderiaceae bacterium]MDP4949237.1 molybdopterin oxidoreductase family protein [Burkholderiaceae bacterium]
MSKVSFNPIATTQALQEGTEIKSTTCYMCACRCGINVHVKDGEVKFIEGNPNHPLNKGVICAKGGSGVMKQYSPARLTKPLLRRPGTDRGDGQFDPISWEQAFDMLSDRLGTIRQTDPKKFALFTGRDQMQALTGLFARQFGTPNYAAHGGFCSVNMAAGMIYSIGGSFWEFGGPDLENAKLFIMMGTAEDHHSNPLKMAISKFKREGGKFISVNPVRTGYSAIADEWIPIRPGTDGALLLAISHVLVNAETFDTDFVAQFTNGPQLVIDAPGSEKHGQFLRADVADKPPIYDQLDQMVWDQDANKAVCMRERPARPALTGRFTVNGINVRPAFELLKESLADCTPEWAQAITGVSAARIEKLAREMAEVAMNQSFELPIAWTDSFGKQYDKVIGRPVAFHAMRGLAAHSNGFQTVRALANLMSLLGTIDRPGGFLHKAPFPRAIPPSVRPPNGESQIKPGEPLATTPLGFPTCPEDLCVTESGEPIRIDKGFSWEHPLSAHGLMHNVITNAWKADPYPIDTLMIFMANMAWNSTMNTDQVRDMLNDKSPDGNYKIPFLVVCDAFHSEMTGFADLVLPDTTYLERYDAMSLLDRPISEFDGPCDSVRVPVVEPLGDCKPFQEVLVELASRLKFPAFTRQDGSPKFSGYEDFIVNFETAPGSGIGFLAGWRGKDGKASLKGEPNPKQWEAYKANNCVFHYEMPEGHRFMRNWNAGYLGFAKDNGLRKLDAPVMIHLYSELLLGFRQAAQGLRKGRQPPQHLRARIERHFSPLPFWSEPLEHALVSSKDYPLSAVTQRPMAMYHSWDSQNAWLRQIHSHNFLFVNAGTAAAAGIADDQWIWVESPWGKVRAQARLSEAVEPGTVWTWNAIGKSKGAWGLGEKANESQKGFLLNHLISEELPLGPEPGAATISNSDPVTGQAGWYDVRVRIYPADKHEPKQSFPQFKSISAPPGMLGRRKEHKV